jgi:hypothetical protein
MTALVISAVIMVIAGPPTNKMVLDVVGMISSFIIIFTPSASGWSNPNGPALLGPNLSCINAATFRSEMCCTLQWLLILKIKPEPGPP